jgi:glutamate formiminotransferase/formiminotetrahydrofolate cyclodeaminase
MEVIEEMAEEGNPASASDAGVGILCARAAVRGAGLNVRTNVGDVEDKAAVESYLERAKKLEDEAVAHEQRILAVVEGKM